MKDKTLKEASIVTIMWLAIISITIYITLTVTPYINQSTNEVASPDGTKVNNVQELQN